MPPFRHQTSVWLALGVVLVLALPRAAFAADRFQRLLGNAVKSYEVEDYTSALEKLSLARQAAKGDKQETTVSIYEGVVYYRLGRLDDARSAFDTALVLDPKATLPPEMPAEIQAEFEAARGRVNGILQPSPPPEPPSVAAVQPPAESDRPEQGSSPSLTPQRSAQAPAVQALTMMDAPPRRIPLLPIVLVGSGVIAGSIGTYFGVSANKQLQAAQVAPLRQEAFTQLNEARGSARTANILFGTAGLALVGGVVTWFLMPGEKVAAPSGDTIQ